MNRSAKVSLFPVLFLALSVSPIGQAQIPVPLHSEPGDPYTLMAYNFTEYSVSLRAQPYLLVYRNDGPTPSEYWITRDGRTVAHGELCCDGARRLEFSQEGPHTLQVNGRGLIALVEPRLADDTDHPTRSAEVAFDGRMGFYAGRYSKADHFCFRSDRPVDVTIYGEKYALLQTLDDATEFEGVFDASWALLTVFFEASAETTLNVTTSLSPCLPNGTSPVVSNPVASPPSTPGLPPLAVLFVAATPFFVRRLRC